MCAGRATHPPTSNGGENIACRNKSLIRGVSKTLPSVPKKKPLSAPGREVGDGPTRRQQQHRLHEVRIESFCWLSQFIRK